MRYLILGVVTGLSYLAFIEAVAPNISYRRTIIGGIALMAFAWSVVSAHEGIKSRAVSDARAERLLAWMER